MIRCLYSTLVPLIIVSETFLSYFLVTLNTLNCPNFIIRDLNKQPVLGDEKLVLICSDQTKEAERG